MSVEGVPGAVAEEVESARVEGVPGAVAEEVESVEEVPDAELWHEAILNNTLTKETFRELLRLGNEVALYDTAHKLRQTLLDYIERRGSDHFASFLDLNVGAETLRFLKEAGVDENSQDYREMTADVKLRKFIAAASGKSSYMCFWVLLAYREQFPCNLRCARQLQHPWSAPPPKHLFTQGLHLGGRRDLERVQRVGRGGSRGP
jgi:hypothetical protein